MARRRKKGYRRKTKVRIVPLLGAAAGGYHVYSTTKPYWGTPEFAEVLAECMTGYNTGSKQWTSTYVLPTYAPMAIGIGIAYVGRKFGLNKHIPLPKGIKLF